MAATYTVTQINSYIKNMFRQDFVLARVSVKGELSNCKYHPSGHLYFTLKDEGGVLSAVMFKTYAAKLTQKLKDGQRVVVSGRIDVYERDGKYQLYAEKIETEGLGALYVRFEQLKEHFLEMGYFEAAYKRPIPKYAKKIGIVTAASGAAIQDICNIARRRNPYVELYLYPALVQGAGAAESIVGGITALDAMGLDVLIVGRGGGSIEDLWAFNEEIVAEAIFHAKTPVISAVGHETDFTIADFVADLRAPTPSAAAELSVAEFHVTETNIARYRGQLERLMHFQTQRYRERIGSYAQRFRYLNPAAQLQEKRLYALRMQEALDAHMRNLLQAKRHQLAMYASGLRGVSPLEKLSQGYAYVETKDRKKVSGIKDVNPGDALTVYLKDGRMKALVKEVYDGKGFDA